MILARPEGGVARIRERPSAGAWIAPGALMRAAPVIILALWAAAALPWLPLRSFIHEEGKNAALAQDILARGNLIVPGLYGVPWIEKPSLLAWLIAGLAELTGGVHEWTARAPAMLSALGTALLVLRLARRYASPCAALFASLAFLFSPMLMQSMAVAEPDTVITFLSFAAFSLWLDGVCGGRVSPLRWLGCAILMAILVMAKGPQPAAFFALGVGADTVRRRSWRELMSLALCLAAPALAVLAWAAAVYRPGAGTVWMGYMRLGAPLNLAANARWLGVVALELMPGLLLAPLAAGLGRPRQSAQPIVPALTLYACVAACALLVWPGANGRYAMPVTPAVATLAGLAWDDAASGWRLGVRRIATGGLAGLIAVQLLLVGLGPPLFPGRFGQSRRAGQMIAAAVRADPAPLYCSSRPNNQPDTDVLFYVGLPIHGLQPSAFAGLVAPAWVEGSAGEIAALLRARPDLRETRTVAAGYGASVVAARLEPAAQRP